MAVTAAVNNSALVRAHNLKETSIPNPSLGAPKKRPAKTLR
jgi:hypothetical protein